MINLDKNTYDFSKYLIENYKIININIFWSETPLKSIMYNDTIFPIKLGKKSIIDKIYHLEEEDWSYIGEEKMKNCIHEFISFI